jgi:peptide/nickel transport system substrate-binding protein
MEEEDMFKQVRIPMGIISLVVMASLVLAACSSISAATNPAPVTEAPATTAATVGSQPTTPSGQPTSTAAASQPAATTAPAANIKNPDTIVEATISDPESLDPAWDYETAGGEVIMNVYQTLVFPKQGSATDFVPMLATSWTVSPDGLTYTFNIRKGVKFQDGQDLTPQDVAYSFWRGLIQDRAGGPQWILLQPFFGLSVQSFKDDVVTKQFNGDWVKATQAVENAITYDNAAGTVTMHLKQTYGPMLQILSGTWSSIVSMPWVIQQGGWDGKPETAEKFHDPSAAQDELFKVMNGTGPYKLDRWAPGQEIDLVRNDNYWQTQPLWDGGPSGPAKIQRVVIKVIPEWGTRFASFQTGDVDIAYVDQQYISQVDPLVKESCDASGKCTTVNPNGTIRVFKNLPTVIEDTIFFNEGVNTTGGNNTIGSGKLDGNGIPADFFSDINVRQAFNYCFDWQTYIQQVWNGNAQQAYGPIINGELGYDPNQAHYSFDLTKCADAFKASTLKSADGKSLWDTGFYLQYVYNTGNDQRKSAGDLLAQNLLKVNPKFHLEVVSEPFPVLLQDQVDGRLPIFMIGWQEDYHDPQDWVVPYLASGGTYGGTQHFPADLQKQLDDLINQGVQASDSQARAKIYEQLQNLAYQNALDIFVVQREGRNYQQEWVKGWYYNPTYPGMPETGSYFYALSKGQ